MTRPYHATKRKRAIGYVRISSERQINGESIETQIGAINEYAAREGMELVKTFVDEAKSGKNTDRPGVREMVAFVKAHPNEIDHAIVYKMNRASRDTAEYFIGFAMPLAEYGVSVRSATEAVDGTPQGRFMEGFSVLVGEYDNHVKQAFTVDNMTSLAFQGYWQGAPMVGYKTHKVLNDIGKLRPTLKPDNKAPLVRRVLERFAEGNITKAELTRYAYAIGLRSRSGKVMRETGVHKLLENPIYAGYIRNNFTEGQLVAGKHEAIISQETYEANQRLLYGKRKRAGEVRQKFHPDYPLKGTLMCPNCGKPMYASAPRSGSGTKSPRYDCFRPSCKGLVRSIKAVSMHDNFEKVLERIQPQEAVIELFKEVIVKRMAYELGLVNSKKAAINAKLDTIADNRLETLKKYAADKLTEEDKNALVDSLDDEKEELTKQLRKLEARQSIQEKDIDLAVAVMRDTKLQWQIASPFAKQKFQSALFPKGLVYDAENERFGTTEISTLYRVLPNKKDLPVSEKSFLVAGAGFEPATLWL